MKKICFVTAARSEYGLLKWLMNDVANSEVFQLQIIVTGGHLSKAQGHTIDQIVEDGFKIDYIVDSQLDTSSTARIAESMGRMASGFAKAFEELKPDFVLVLGDRYELLPICNTAFVMCIPIIHLSGGDVTEGAIDDGVRNAVTMLAEYHFPGTQSSADNIVRMRGTDRNVWAVGEPGLDSFIREKLLSREELAKNLGLDISSKWVLMTYHAETKESIDYNLDNVKSCLEILSDMDNVQVIVTYANADFGGAEINSYSEDFAASHADKIKVIPSLGHFRYLSFMRQVDFVIGNSSSGIVEAPFMNIPTINIGDRQKGRYLCGNIIQCDANYETIKSATQRIELLKSNKPDDLNFWGDGYTSERILNILKDAL